ncbi:MAG: adenosylcobinamide-phosphate synthase CbiB [Rikenellaceae bacterium]
MDLNSQLIIASAIAFILDSIIGDPHWAPHPIRLFGNAISLCEKRLNNGRYRRLKGGAVWLLLILCSYYIFHSFNQILLHYPTVWSIFTTLTIFWGISSRCLINEGLKVEKILRRGDIEGARKQLRMIVGRDTSQLSPTQIRAAVIETLAENLSDGTIAPLFFFVIGGTPLMMCYKMINTLDSMVGYKSDRFIDFGFVSAKMDDVANYIPARITALLMAIVSLSRRAIRFIIKYGNKHASPNAGYPEAAIAGILNCRLGGANIYFGKVVEKPHIGDNNRDLNHRDLITCCYVNAKVATLAYIIVLLLIA